MLLEDRLGSALAVSALLDGKPPQLGERYRVLRLLGRGARGVVVEAHDRRLDRVVALKLFPADEIDAGQLREARCLAELAHPHIVQVFDVDRAVLQLSDGDIPCVFVCMEHVKGCNLRELAALPNKNYDIIIDSYLAAAEGLAAAHAAGVVHGDVKPENLLLDTAGRVRVVDFGNARSPVTCDSGEAQETRYGTWEYLAPEARNDAPTERSDQYGLAVSMWEALAGVHPFGGRPAKTKQEPLTGEGLPAALEAPLRKAMAVDPEDRFTLMGEFRDALASARLRMGTQRPSRAARRLAITATAVSVLAALFALASFAHTGQGDVATMSEESLDDASEKCSELSGSWPFETLITTSTIPRLMGVNGYFTLRLSHRSSCRFDATLEKTGDSQMKVYTVRMKDQSYFNLAPTAQGSLEGQTGFFFRYPKGPEVVYGFHFEIRGEALSGRFRVTDRSGNEKYRGTVAGVRPSQAGGALAWLGDKDTALVQPSIYEKTWSANEPF